MKAWRKQAMKSGKRSGRAIKRSIMLGELIGLPKTYPLLNSLMIRAGIEVQAPTVHSEVVNETE